ncbi:hypothetical protein J6590_105607 [Homalodisca vitripennis]|nr:hypothetical protein J6590_105607 [Homalodisca vitripennis]
MIVSVTQPNMREQRLAILVVQLKECTASRHNSPDKILLNQLQSRHKMIPRTAIGFGISRRTVEGPTDEVKASNTAIISKVEEDTKTPLAYRPLLDTVIFERLLKLKLT